MKKNKSIIIILFIILSFILIIFLTKNKPAISYNKSMLIDNKESFETVANICINFHNKNGGAEEFWVYSVDYDNNNLICNHNQQYYSLNQEEKQAFITVTSTFKLDHHGLSDLFVSNNFVVFGIANGRASFIYSHSNEKPYFVNSPKLDKYTIFDIFNVFIGKIVDKWYYACKKS